MHKRNELILYVCSDVHCWWSKYFFWFLMNFCKICMTPRECVPLIGIYRKLLNIPRLKTVIVGVERKQNQIASRSTCGRPWWMLIGYRRFIISVRGSRSSFVYTRDSFVSSCWFFCLPRMVPTYSAFFQSPLAVSWPLSSIGLFVTWSTNFRSFGTKLSRTWSHTRRPFTCRDSRGIWYFQSWWNHRGLSRRFCMYRRGIPVSEYCTLNLTKPMHRANRVMKTYMSGWMRLNKMMKSRTSSQNRYFLTSYTIYSGRCTFCKRKIFLDFFIRFSSGSKYLPTAVAKLKYRSMCLHRLRLLVCIFGN